jgi:hypothetical protein
MKSKPGTKSAPVAAKPPVTAAKPNAPKAAGIKSVAGKPTLPGDDFPFEVELTVGKAAIQAMPNPTKQRSLKLICPKCDTPGYLPANAAGQDVRCANPKCVMPVFTAPAPKKVEVAPPPPPPKPSNLPFVAGATVVLMLTIGAGLYFVNSLPANSGARLKELSEEDRLLMGESVGGPKNKRAVTATKKENSAAETKENVVATPDATSVDKETRIKSALQQMKDSSLDKVAQRSKPYCRQQAAEACAMLGETSAMRDHLDQLMKVGIDVSYYRITPLLDLFWVDFAKGDKKSSANSMDIVMSEVPKIPKFGRTRLEIAGRVAAALVASGRSQDALTLLTDFQATDLDAQLAARLQIAMDGKVSPISDRYSILPWKYPQAVATTASLINRGQLESAEKWAASQTSDDAKAECLSIWAEEIASRKAAPGSVDAGGAIAAAVSSLPPVLASRVWSRAGSGRLLAGDEAGVMAAIKLAQSKLGEVNKPVECKMPAVKVTEGFRLPAAGPLLQGATAAAELAYLQAQFTATKAAAEDSLDLALAFVDATAPSLAVAQQRQDEVKRLGLGGLQKLLKEELRKKNDDEARTAANNYRRSLNDITEAAQQRFDIETQLLSRLRGAGLGLDSKIWIIVNTRTIADDINKRDNFFATNLAGELREGLKGTTEEQALLGAWSILHPGSEPPPSFLSEFNRKLETNPTGAVEYLQKTETKSNRREEIALMAASRLPTEGKLSTAFQFIGRMDDIIDRENCYRVAAAIASKRGQAEEVWKQVSKVNQQTEKVALCRGLIAGLLAADKPNP